MLYFWDTDDETIQSTTNNCQKSLKAISNVVIH